MRADRTATLVRRKRNGASERTCSKFRVKLLEEMKPAATFWETVIFNIKEMSKARRPARLSEAETSNRRLERSIRIKPDEHRNVSRGVVGSEASSCINVFHPLPALLPRCRWKRRETDFSVSCEPGVIATAHGKAPLRR